MEIHLCSCFNSILEDNHLDVLMAHTHNYNILLRHSVVHHTRHSCVGYRDQRQPEYDNSIFVSGYGIENINQEKICVSTTTTTLPSVTEVKILTCARNGI